MDELDATRDLTRRSFLRGTGAVAGAGAASLLLPGRSLGAQPARRITDDVLQGFDDDVRAAMETFGMVGAGVALVEGDEIVYNRGFGTRDVAGDEPATPRTRFRVGSNTKSMTSLMLARYVDDGRLRWNSRAAELWPQFRTPSKRLTSNLRVDDLLGMGSGVSEGETIEFFVSGGASSALDVLRSIPYLPVIARPDTTYYYNNTLVAAAAHLAAIAEGTELDALDDRFADELRWVVFDPIGMADAAIAADPRPLGPDSATGLHPRPVWQRDADPFHQHRRLRTGRLGRGELDRHGALPDHADATRGDARRHTDRFGRQRRADASARGRRAPRRPERASRSVPGKTPPE